MGRFARPKVLLQSRDINLENKQYRILPGLDEVWLLKSVDFLRALNRFFIALECREEPLF